MMHITNIVTHHSVGAIIDRPPNVGLVTNLDLKIDVGVQSNPQKKSAQKESDSRCNSSVWLFLIHQIQSKIRAQVSNRPAMEFDQTVGADPNTISNLPETAVLDIMFGNNPALSFP